jgi:hypothetical protein
MSTREQLRATLKELENELAALESLDESTRAMLVEAKRDIEAKLNQPERTEPPTESITSGLREAVERFESSHPTLTGIVSRIADALAQLGI